MSFDSPTSPNKSITQRITLSPERAISPISSPDDFNFTIKLTKSKENSPSKRSDFSSSPRITPPRDMENNHSKMTLHNTALSEKNGNSPSLQSFNSVLESLSPHREKKVCSLISVFC